MLDDFLSFMDDQIDWLESEAAKHNIPISLNASCCESLEKLFDLLSQGKEKAGLAGLSVAFARNLGEHVRQTHHGEWTLSLDDPKNVNFNTPVIIGHSAVPGLEFAPLAVMRAYALRRRAETLARALDAQIKPKPLDLSDLVD